jgi:hypothetical protein
MRRKSSVDSLRSHCDARTASARVSFGAACCRRPATANGAKSHSACRSLLSLAAADRESAVRSHGRRVLPQSAVLEYYTCGSALHCQAHEHEALLCAAGALSCRAIAAIPSFLPVGSERMQEMNCRRRPTVYAVYSAHVMPKPTRACAFKPTRHALVNALVTTSQYVRTYVREYLETAHSDTYRRAQQTLVRLAMG